jgi:hypothetical protein
MASSLNSSNFIESTHGPPRAEKAKKKRDVFKQGDLLEDARGALGKRRDPQQMDDQYKVVAGVVMRPEK